MRQSLFHLFSTYGEVSEINLKQTNNMRGQAFIVFREQDMADRALQELKGFNLFGKEMVIN